MVNQAKPKMLWIQDVLAEGVPDFKMQMRSTGATGIPAVSDDLPLFDGEFMGVQGHVQFELEVLVMAGLHPLGDGGGVTVQMRIHRGVTSGVVEVQGQAVACRRCFDAGHMPVGYRKDGNTDFATGSVIQSAMQMVGAQLPKDPGAQRPPGDWMNPWLGLGVQTPQGPHKDP